MNTHFMRKPAVLRLVVLSVVVLTAVRFLLRSNSKLPVPDPAVFWGHREIGGGAVLNEKQTPQKKEALVWARQQTSQSQEPQKSQGGEAQDSPKKPKVTPRQDTNQTPLRVVHFDLKGAAPKLTYLEQVFPLLSSLGANGILLEYEDMFPYEGDLQILRSPHAYSVEDIQKIRHLAELSKLEIIPLVQVFGHLEFALKHEKFSNLREVPGFPNSLNPHAPGSQPLVQAMLSQVLDRHPGLRWLHIGADEVFGLGQGLDSKNWLNSNNGDMGRMFLNHVREIVHFATERHPGLRLLMWDDMMRHISVDTLKASSLTSFVSPMIWDYGADLQINQIEKFISNYQAAGFEGVWFASAFKGASGVAQDWTPLTQHMKNHLSWLKVMAVMPKYPSIHFQGIALTGWQRYDHFTVLCELFPVGIPSLAVCLQSLAHGGFNEEAKKQVLHMLGCKNINLEKSLCEGGGAFPGYEVYQMVLHIRENLKSQIHQQFDNQHLKGWFSRYHRKYKFGNPRNMEFFKDKMSKLLEEWEDYLQNFRTQMEAIYFADTVEEWMEENVNEHMDKLRELAADFEQVIKSRGGQKPL
nr:PREDICTED: hexosaminidase D-like isoform X1 [Lepisosteus oculatus]XP_015215976.1 PREDICTED: hexosaminidase D-like isoform X1 [Lepisosteus oculatus]XP_015215977.1 PREDICTED: hexosaminidase D-like isoform X1 [Lepisosteus oculatus]XP_015215978.1 PREDICTED: hexosaminidase D-like isoform X1 [Lepisosteus oculatus]XP_015215979.1 PREDICTED: hexosaminidase D-like isoform X1 [Lepisosteus oculatus]